MATETTTKTVASGTHLNSIGIVKAVVGLVKAVDENGTERVLQAGDKVYANETIVTSADGTVLIEFQDNTHLDLPHSSHIVLDADVYTPKATNIEEKAADEAAQIEKALAEGKDVSTLTEAAAAGGAGGDEGSSTPLVIDFNNSHGNVTSGFPTGPLAGGATPPPPTQILVPTTPTPAPTATTPTITATPPTYTPPGETPPGTGQLSGLGKSGIVFEAGLPGIGSLDQNSMANIATNGTIKVGDSGGLGSISAITIGNTTFTIGAGGLAALVNQEVHGNFGVLKITGYDGNGTFSYQYTLSGPVTTGTASTVNGVHVEGTDNFTVTVSDHSGGSASTSVVIGIVDDVPTAHPDTNAAIENASVSGNVITGAGETGAPNAGKDVQGADQPALVTSVTGEGSPVAVTGTTTNVTITGAHGTLTIDGNGDYTYAVNPALHMASGTTTTDTFSYTIKDADGSPSTTTLTLTITGTDVVPHIGGSNPETSGNTDTVYEAGLALGSHVGNTTTSGSDYLQVTDTNHGGFSDIAKITINGTDYTVAGVAGLVLTQGGVTITITGFDTTTGHLNYSYALNTAETAVGGVDPSASFTASVTDLAGQTSTTAKATINVVDDRPVAHPDTNAVNEAASVNGNVITGAGETNAGADVQGADRPALVTSVTSLTGEEPVAVTVTGTTSNVTVTGAFGTLTIDGNGDYTYKVDSSFHLVSGATVTDTFNYVLTDKDGSSSTTTLTLTITGTDVGPHISGSIPETSGNTGTVYEAGLPLGSGTGPTFTTGSDYLQVTDASPNGGLNNITSITINGQSYSVVNGVVDLSGAGFTLNGGAISITNLSFDHTGKLYYTYTLNTAEQAVNGTDPSASFKVTVTDLLGQSASTTVNVNVVDDKPVAHPDTNAVNEAASVSGNVITGAGETSGIAGADVQGADRPTLVTSVTSVTGEGSPVAVTGTTTNATIAGAYGTLTIDGNGDYTYTVAPSVHQALGSTLTDTFRYVLMDADGSSSTTTLTLTIKGTDVAPTITTSGQTDVVYEAGLPGIGSHVGNTTITGTDHMTVADSNNGGLNDITGITINGTHYTVANGAVVGPIADFTLNNGAVGISGITYVNGVLNYTYTLLKPELGNGTTDPSAHFTVTVQDTVGQTASATATVNVADDKPIAHPDTNAVNEAASVTGNVITGAGETNAGADVQGADQPVLVTSVISLSHKGSVPVPVMGTTTNATVTGAFGTLKIDGNGDYTYTVNPALHLALGRAVTDRFSYTIKDADGSSSTTTLTLTIKGTDVAPTITTSGQNDVVYEAGLPTIGSHVGTTTISGTDHMTVTDHNNGGLNDIRSITINGVYHTVANGAVVGPIADFTLNNGAVGISGITYVNGVLNYTYTLLKPELGNGTTDPSAQFTVTVRDTVGQTASATATINVADDKPVAMFDYNAVNENASVTGNVITGAGETGAPNAGKDVQGADQPALVTSVTGTGGPVVVTGTTTNATITGAHGTLTIDGNGDYTYKVDPSFHLASGSTVFDVFRYTLTDADGSSSTTTLTLTITGTDVGPHISGSSPETSGNTDTVYEAGLVLGSHVGNTTITGSDYLQVTDASPNGGLNNITMLTINGHPYNVVNGVVDLSGAGFTLNGGAISITNLSFDNTGKLHYTYTLNTAEQAVGGTDPSASFTVKVTDLLGQSASSTVNVNVVDDKPIAHPDTNAVNEATSVSGNVITGLNETNAGADTLSADRPVVVTGVVAGASTGDLTNGAVGTMVTGSHGWLTLVPNGSYVYTVDPALHLASGATMTDTFSYTIKDADGSFSTTTLVLTITGTDVAPTITTSGQNDVVYEAALPLGSHAGNTTTISGSDHMTVTDHNNGGLNDITVITINGTQYSVVNGAVVGAIAGFTLNNGAVGISGITYVNGVLNYTYTLLKAEMGTGGIDPQAQFTVIVRDTVGQTASATATIHVVDDAPIANPDTNTGASGLTISGNVITGSETNASNVTTVSGTDILGADRPVTVTAVTAAGVPFTIMEGGFHIVTAKGTLNLYSDGHYTYRANPNTSGTDVFHYTITDADGSSSSTTLTITVAASGLTATAVTGTVYEAGLPLGSQANNPADPTQISGQLVAHESIAGGALTYSLVPDNATHYGTLTINANGTYTYVLSGATSADAAGSVNDTFTYKVTDAAGNTTTSTVTVTVMDDKPTLNTPSGYVHDDAGTKLDGFAVYNMGADGLGHVNFNFVNATSNGSSLALTTTVGGATYNIHYEPITNANGLNGIQGYYQTSASGPHITVFKLTPDTSNPTGAYTFTLVGTIDQPVPKIADSFSGITASGPVPSIDIPSGVAGVGDLLITTTAGHSVKPDNGYIGVDSNVMKVGAEMFLGFGTVANGTITQALTVNDVSVVNKADPGGKFHFVYEQNGVSYVSPEFTANGTPTTPFHVAGGYTNLEIVVDSGQFKFGGLNYTAVGAPQNVTLNFNATATDHDGTSTAVVDPFSVTITAGDGHASTGQIITVPNSLGQLIGTPGDDTIIGGAGNDILVGNGGNDHLIGGLGNDTFVLPSLINSNTANGVATITDFTVGNPTTNTNADVLDISHLLQGAGISAATFEANAGGYLTFTQNGTNVQVNFDATGHSGGVEVAVLQNVNATTLLTTLLGNHEVKDH